MILNSHDRVNSRGESIRGNGLDEAIVHVGRRVLIDESKFIEIIAEQSKRVRAAGLHSRVASEVRRARATPVSERKFRARRGVTQGGKVERQ